MSGKASMMALPTARDNSMPLAHKVDRDSCKMFLPAEIEARFARIEQEYKAREKLTGHGLRHRKKILLYGPPGCGKSLGARRMAYNCNLPIISARLDSMIDSHLGESAKNIRKVFESAKESPCVLLIDECDALMFSRKHCGSDGASGEMRRAVNSMLQLMEEIDPPGLIVCSTNMANELDPAMFRRFDDVIEVPLPGEQEILSLVDWFCPLEIEGDEWKCKVSILHGRSADWVVKFFQNLAKDAILAGKETLHGRDVAEKIWSLPLADMDKFGSP